MSKKVKGKKNKKNNDFFLIMYEEDKRKIEGNLILRFSIFNKFVIFLNFFRFFSELLVRLIVKK